MLQTDVSYGPRRDLLYDSKKTYCMTKRRIISLMICLIVCRKRHISKCRHPLKYRHVDSVYTVAKMQRMPSVAGLFSQKSHLVSDFLATHCNTLQQKATQCKTLQHTAIGRLIFRGHFPENDL